LAMMPKSSHGQSDNVKRVCSQLFRYSWIVGKPHLTLQRLTPTTSCGLGNA
jgi:hypothetical protein